MNFSFLFAVTSTGNFSLFCSFSTFLDPFFLVCVCVCVYSLYFILFCIGLCCQSLLFVFFFNHQFIFLSLCYFDVERDFISNHSPFYSLPLLFFPLHLIFSILISACRLFFCVYLSLMPMQSIDQCKNKRTNKRTNECIVQFINGALFLHLIELLSLFCIPSDHSEWFVIDLYKININCLLLMLFFFSLSLSWGLRIDFIYFVIVLCEWLCIFTLDGLVSELKSTITCNGPKKNFELYLSFPTFFTLHRWHVCTIKYSLLCPKYYAISPSFSFDMCIVLLREYSIHFSLVVFRSFPMNILH